ncbi:hypothetical protein [Streptomyces sp. NPDC059063]|uniref:hypothetical protein n=1 Tax=unclassified Streptomyces TaxID=2593676 RepID=UPI0036C14271
MVGDLNLNFRNRNRTDQQARERSLRLRPAEQLARTGRSTHQSGGELDYALTYRTPGTTSGTAAAATRVNPAARCAGATPASRSCA